MRRVRAAAAWAARTATLGSVGMLLLSIYALAAGAPAGAADGAQGPPTLTPESVSTPADAFTIVPPPDARCEATGADNWRWHTFIVEKGRDLSTLRFGPYGPGDDYDATDGEITAGLIASGNGVWQEVPALKPEGLINPTDLGGLSLDPNTYKLRDGDYVVGMACTDGDASTRQWWSLTVTVNTAEPPFLRVAGAAAVTAAPPSAPMTSTAAPPDGGGEIQGARTASTELAAAAAPSSTVGLSSTTGVSWAPLFALTEVSSHLPIAGWAVLAAVFARIAYLLTRPVRVLAPLSP